MVTEIEFIPDDPDKKHPIKEINKLSKKIEKEMKEFGFARSDGYCQNYCLEASKHMSEIYSAPYSNTCLILRFWIQAPSRVNEFTWTGKLERIVLVARNDVHEEDVFRSVTVIEKVSGYTRTFL